MPTSERVTVTLPADVLQRIDRLVRNRSRFIAEAVERELARRRREELLLSVSSPHPEASEVAELGLVDWGESLPEEADPLVDDAAGTAVRWVEGAGWIQEEE